MNEEEKKTVEELRKQLRLAINIDDVTTTIRNDDAETILNLIEKLQKENEEKTILLFAGAEKVKKLEKEKEELMKLMVHKNAYTKKLEEDLFENASNYVIPKQKLKDEIEEILNNKEYRIVFEGDEEIPDNATNINVQKYIKLEKMQELLEE